MFTIFILVGNMEVYFFFKKNDCIDVSSGKRIKNEESD
jgi:hypothetical protein